MQTTEEMRAFASRFITHPGHTSDSEAETLARMVLALADRWDALARVSREARSALLAYDDRLAEFGCESWIQTKPLLEGFDAALAEPIRDGGESTQEHWDARD